MNNIEIKLLTKKDILNYADKIALMRIENFKEFPYLYQGNLEYEKKYLKTYLENPQAILIAGFCGKDIIAISTGLPVMNNSELLQNIKTLFEANNLNLSEYYYFAETIINFSYRGRGLYSKIISLREQAAIARGYNNGCFVTVIRENKHPLKPANYKSPEPIFEHCGYQKSSIIFTYSWPTLQMDGSVKEQKNPLVFWFKKLQ